MNWYKTLKFANIHSISRNELISFINMLGFYSVRTSGGHEIFKNQSGKMAVVPLAFNPNLAQAIITKDIGIDRKTAEWMLQNIKRLRKDPNKIKEILQSINYSPLFNQRGHNGLV